MCLSVCLCAYLCWAGGLASLHVNSGGILKIILPRLSVSQRGERRGFAQRDTGGLCQSRAVSANTLAIIPLPCEWAIENSRVRGGERACILMMG